MALFDPRFRDIAERETKALNELSVRKNQLIAKSSGGTAKIKIALTKEENAELRRIEEVLKAVEGSASTSLNEVVDRLFVGVRELFRDENFNRKHVLLTQKDGHLVFGDAAASGPAAAASGAASGSGAKAAASPPDEDLVVTTALTLGILAADGAAAPEVLVDGSGPPLIVPDRGAPEWKSLNRAFYAALGETKGLEDLAILVLPILSIEGDPDGKGGLQPVVDAVEFALVMRELSARGVTAADYYQLKREVNRALDKLQFVGKGQNFDDTGILPPDLGEISSTNIVTENVRLMGPMMVSAMMDEVKAFQTLDFLSQRFQDATLVRFSKIAGRKLYTYWRDAPNRMSEMERRTFYAITLGIPGGEPGDFINRNFNDLWLRFVTSISELVRQKELDNLLRARIPAATHQQQCRKAARDLLENLSLHGYGMAIYAAEELTKQVNTMIEILSDPDIRANYGARDMWQVIDQVATLNLGGAKSSSRYRTMATCGTIITAWLANNVTRIMETTDPIIDMNMVRHPQPRPQGQKAITHPNDHDLVNACELWIADSAIPDSRVEQLVSEPRESPTQTSRPIELPAVVQDILGDIGVGPGSR